MAATVPDVLSPSSSGISGAQRPFPLEALGPFYNHHPLRIEVDMTSSTCGASTHTITGGAAENAVCAMTDSPHIGDPVPMTGLRVLLVEDTWHVAYGTKVLLENLGLEVEGPAATVAEADALLSQQTPDIALVDVNLQGTMAYGFIERLIAMGVPTVVVSGYEVLPSLEGRVAAILTKPTRARVLLATMRRIVSQQRSQ